MKATQEQIIKALKAKGGYVTQAAESLGMTFQAVNQRINKNKQIKEAFDAINEGYLDFAESKVMVAVKDGQAWAICFHLKCKGKHRGWVERQEVTGAGGGPVTFRVVNETGGKKIGTKKSGL